MSSNAASVLLLTALLALPAAAKDVELAEPKPSFDNPRKIVLQLSEDEPRAVNNLLYNAVNLQKFYGQDMVQVAVVAYGPGVRALLKESSPVAERISSLQRYEVEFVACGNTLETIGKTVDALLPGVSVVQTGLAEVTERQLKGWIAIKP